MPLLEFRNVTKAFGGLTVIDGLTLHVDEREIVSVIGPNGAGKTTLFNLVTASTAPTRATSCSTARASSVCSPTRSPIAAIARTFQTLRLFLNMSVKENVMAAAYGHTRSSIIESILRLPRARREEREVSAMAEEKLGFFGQRLMGYRWNQPRTTSRYANRRRLEMARAMGTRPRLLLSTSRLAGMNPVETRARRSSSATSVPSW